MPARRRLGAWLIVYLLPILALGCGKRPESQLEGGTAGTIHFQGAPVADLQVNVFAKRDGEFHRVAFGVSDAQGDFWLIDDKGLSSARLPPGQYRVTVESVAADPIPVAAIYGSLHTTPLNLSLSSADDEFTIEVQ